jgi:hypothetical protein
VFYVCGPIGPPRPKAQAGPRSAGRRHRGTTAGLTTSSTSVVAPSPLQGATTPCCRRSAGARHHRHMEGCATREEAPMPPSPPGLCPSVTSGGGGEEGEGESLRGAGAVAPMSPRVGRHGGGGGSSFSLLGRCFFFCMQGGGEYRDKWPVQRINLMLTTTFRLIILKYLVLASSPTFPSRWSNREADCVTHELTREAFISSTSN